MNNQRLTDLRDDLRVVSQQKWDDYSEEKEEHEEGDLLSLLMTTQEFSEANTAEKLLSRIPQPEYDDVLDYQAICRVVDRKLYDEGDLVQDMGHIENSLMKAKFELESRAANTVKRRINVVKQNWDDGLVILHDPITKMEQRFASSRKEETKEESLDRMKHQFAISIITYGVDNP